MISGLVLITIAIVLIALGNRLVVKDEIYGLAAYVSSTLAAIWGLVVAPGPASLTLGMLALGWIQLTSPKH